MDGLWLFFKTLFWRQVDISFFVIIFQNFQLLNSSGAALVPFAKIPCQLFLQKLPRNSLFQPKIEEKTKSQSCINCEKVPISKHYKNGFWRTRFQINVFIKVFPWRSMSFYMPRSKRSISKWIGWASACFGVKLFATSWRGARNRWCGALGVFLQCYSEQVRHTGFLARHIQSTARNLLETSPSCSFLAWIFQVDPPSWCCIKLYDKWWWFMGDKCWNKNPNPTSKVPSKEVCCGFLSLSFVTKDSPPSSFLPCFIISYPAPPTKFINPTFSFLHSNPKTPKP